MLVEDHVDHPFDLSIIIVSWNVKALLADCLRSVAAGSGEIAVETIVVDGASADGSADMVAQQFPWVKLIACDQNVGFPRGNNIGMEQAAGRHILLLNPDTELVGDALKVLVAYLDQHAEVGGVGPMLLNPDGSVQSSRRRFPTLMTGLLESTWLAPLGPGVMRRYYAQDLPDDVEADIDWVVGACLMVPRQVAAQVGGMDEAYFMYSEELDWCRRIKDAGWKVRYLPAAQVVHHEGKSSEQAVTARHINFQRAKLRYFYKYHGRLKGWILRVVLLKNYAFQLLIELAKGVLGHRRQLRRQRVRAYWQVLRSGLKPAGR